MPAEATAQEQEGEAARVLESLFESYASACRSGAEVDDGADAAFEVWGQSWLQFCGACRG